MVKKIVWTFEAHKRYKHIIDYLLTDWTEKQALEFTLIVDRKLYTLARFPSLGIRSEKRPYARQLLLTKHNRLIYEVRGDKIYLLDIYDTRQIDRN